jgi:hypothetical protein
MTPRPTRSTQTSHATGFSSSQATDHAPLSNSPFADRAPCLLRNRRLPTPPIEATRIRLFRFYRQFRLFRLDIFCGLWRIMADRNPVRCHTQRWPRYQAQSENERSGDVF